MSCGKSAEELKTSLVVLIAILAELKIYKVLTNNLVICGLRLHYPHN